MRFQWILESGSPWRYSRRERSSISGWSAHRPGGERRRRSKTSEGTASVRWPTTTSSGRRSALRQENSPNGSRRWRNTGPRCAWPRRVGRSVRSVSLPEPSIERGIVSVIRERGGAPPAANVKEVWAVRPTWSCRGTTRRSRTRRRSRTDSCTVHPQTRARSASKLLANHTSISLLANAPAAPSPEPAISSPAARSVGRPAGTQGSRTWHLRENLGKEGFGVSAVELGLLRQRDPVT